MGSSGIFVALEFLWYSMVICGIFMSMVFSCILFSVGLNINYTVLFCNFACINIFIIGSRCFTKMSCKNDFTDKCCLAH